MDFSTSSYITFLLFVFLCGYGITPCYSRGDIEEHFVLPGSIHINLPELLGDVHLLATSYRCYISQPFRLTLERCGELGLLALGEGDKPLGFFVCHAKPLLCIEDCINAFLQVLVLKVHVDERDFQDFLPVI